MHGGGGREGGGGARAGYIGNWELSALGHRLTTLTGDALNPITASIQQAESKHRLAANRLPRFASFQFQTGNSTTPTFHPRARLTTANDVSVHLLRHPFHPRPGFCSHPRRPRRRPRTALLYPPKLQGLHPRLHRHPQRRHTIPRPDPERRGKRQCASSFIFLRRLARFCNGNHRLLCSFACFV